MKALTILSVAALALTSTLLLGPVKLTKASAQSPISQDARTTGSSLQQTIVAKESEGLDALKTGNVEHFAKLTADEGIFVDAHGPATKAEVVNNVAAFTLSDYSMEDIRFVPLSANSGLISYKIHEKGVSHGKEFPAQAYVSSIWAQRGNEWVCLFSQETGARQPSSCSAGLQPGIFPHRGPPPVLYSP